MCFDCYQRYGAPRVFNHEVEAAALAISGVYQHHSVGGNLHVAIDDWNIDDSTLGWLAEKWMPAHRDETEHEQFVAESMCLSLLLALSLDERATAMAIAKGYIKPYATA